MFSFTYRKLVGGYSDKELLTNFTSTNWANLSESQRLIVAQEVENRAASKQGRTPCQLKPTKKEGYYGCYYPGSNDIEINVSDTIKGKNCRCQDNSSYTVLDTIYHEGEHSFQQYCIKHNIDAAHGIPQTTKDMCIVENSGNNYDGVIDYNNCTCELDSNNVATRKVLESEEIFRNDPKFSDYLEDRRKYFSNVANRNMAEVHMQQNEAIYQAYKNGDIDLYKHDDMLLNEVNKSQPAFDEARQLRSRIETEQKMVVAQQNNHEEQNISAKNESGVGLDGGASIDFDDETEERKYKH